MTRVGRAAEKDETLGFIKVLADPSTKQILGASILGTNADEAIHGISVGHVAAAGDVFRWAPVSGSTERLLGRTELARIIHSGCRNQSSST
jgi:hypothetical protein